MNVRLEKLRDEQGLLRKNVAQQMQVVESVYSEWENEKLNIPTRRLFQLANFYHINIDYIVGLTNKQKHISNNTTLDISLVALRIKEIRKDLNLTMRDLAHKLNTSSSAISNYENGKFLILSPFLIELCKMSNCSIDWVLGRCNDKYLTKEKELVTN